MPGQLTDDYSTSISHQLIILSGNNAQSTFETSITTEELLTTNFCNGFKIKQSNNSYMLRETATFCCQEK